MTITPMNDNKGFNESIKPFNLQIVDEARKIISFKCETVIHDIEVKVNGQPYYILQRLSLNGGYFSYKIQHEKIFVQELNTKEQLLEETKQTRRNRLCGLW